MAFPACILLLILIAIAVIDILHELVRPSSRLPATAIRPDNLPEAILDTQLELYRINGETSDGLARSYTVLAKNVGAATHKARQWGLHVRAVERISE